MLWQLVVLLLSVSLNCCAKAACAVCRLARHRRLELWLTITHNLGCKSTKSLSKRHVAAVARPIHRSCAHAHTYTLLCTESCYCNESKTCFASLVGVSGRTARACYHTESACSRMATDRHGSELWPMASIRWHCVCCWRRWLDCVVCYHASCYVVAYMAMYEPGARVVCCHVNCSEC